MLLKPGVDLCGRWRDVFAHEFVGGVGAGASTGVGAGEGEVNGARRFCFPRTNSMQVLER